MTVATRNVVPFRPPRRRRLHEEVAEQLRDAIFDGRIAAGAKLPSERDLAEEFQVNRASIRDAMKVLEGLGLVSVRQGDGVTVRPRTEASFDALPSMIFHGDRIDLALMSQFVEVMTPMLLEMGRLAIERHGEAQLAALRALRDRLAANVGHEANASVLREILVLLSDMTHNTVWQMLARSTRAFLEAPPLAGARRRYGRDPIRLLPVIDRCLAAIGEGRRDDAARELQAVIRQLYEGVLGAAQDAHDEQNGGSSR